MASCTQARMSLLVSVQEIVRWCHQTTTTHHWWCCCLERQATRSTTHCGGVDCGGVDRSEDEIARCRETRCIERRVVMWVRCNIIVLESSVLLLFGCRIHMCWRGRVVVVVDCSAVECDDRYSQRPTRDLRCLMTSTKAPRRPQMIVEL